jgi:lantibiotic leader peptide-processing serine protease
MPNMTFSPDLQLDATSIPTVITHANRTRLDSVRPTCGALIKHSLRRVVELAMIAFAFVNGRCAELPPMPAATSSVEASAAASADPDLLSSRLIVVFRNQAVPDNFAAQVEAMNLRVSLRLDSMGIVVLTVPIPPQSVNAGQPFSVGQQQVILRQLRAIPEVAYVVHDRMLHGSSLHVRSIPAAMTKTPETPDLYYTSTPQAWAVKQVGGYGSSVPGAPASGPWNVTMGKGVTIAILDSGVDPKHPDIASNLSYSASLVDQTALPSPCDDGSPTDQDGHGTWVASLASGAIGPGTGMVVGVAPQSTILNIKVLERIPAAGSQSTQVLCENGSPAGLMSWVLAGISTASAQGADVISLSLGGLIDSYSGEGAGLIAAFNRAAYMATSNGSLLIAAVGNNAQSLDNNRYVEMPAQAEDVLAVLASTNPQCAQTQTAGSPCTAGPVSLANYSNYGVTLQAVAAPGGSNPTGPVNGTGVTGYIRGACSSGLAGTVDGLPSSSGHSLGCFNLGHTAYVEAVGTSASAPLVAGVAALLKAASPQLTPQQIANLIRTSATPVSTSTGFTLNMVDAGSAVSNAVQQEVHR